jgi:hypothetical protein
MRTWGKTQKGRGCLVRKGLEHQLHHAEQVGQPAEEGQEPEHLVLAGGHQEEQDEVARAEHRVQQVAGQIHGHHQELGVAALQPEDGLLGGVEQGLVEHRQQDQQGAQRGHHPEQSHNESH